MLAGLWLGAAPARAAMVTGLYEVRVPVTDQSASQRNSALQQAFAAVLVKVTGSRAAPGALAAALGTPSQYVQQYRYEQLQPDPGSQVPQSQSQVLWAVFDAAVVNKALHAVHAPQWGAERPRTLVWLALADTPGGRILANNDSSFLMQALQAAADQRGIQLVFPQMDGTDRAVIGVPDVIGFNPDRIRLASDRYRPDAVLVGNVTAFGSGQYAARWQLLSSDRVENWDTPPGDEVLVAVDGPQTAADRDAARYAIAPGATDVDGVVLQVDGVTALDAYVKVLAYVGGLTPVRAVHVERVAEGSVYLKVDIHGSLDNLQAALVLGGLMAASSTASAPAASSGAPPAGTSLLRYRYVPGP
jgi:hypothetical protein